MKIPTRPAPSVPRAESSRENFYHFKKPVGEVKPKKKPPPRPPPPKFNNKKPDFTTSLIDLSSPLEEYIQATSTRDENLLKPMSNNPLSSISSTNDDLFKFKSSHTDLFKLKPPSLSNNYAVGNSSFFENSVNYLDLTTGVSSGNLFESVGPKTNVVAPTIIRAQAKSKKDFNTFQVNDASRSEIEANNYSPPMPTVPPPSPPKLMQDHNVNLPHGVALYNYPATHKDDLPLQENDIVILIRQINEEWFYGKIGDSEGMFPANFIDIRVPLPNPTMNNLATVLYQFNPETFEDLKLVPGQKVKVLKKISQDWLYGESNGHFGQFPANFIDQVPDDLDSSI